LTKIDRQKFYVVADPSAILSFPHLNDFMKFLEGLNEQRIEFQVLLPPLLYSGLEYLERGIQEEELDKLAEVYQEWLPSDSEQDARNRVIELVKNEEFKDLFKHFRDRYLPQNSEDLTINITPKDQGLIDRLLTKEDLNRELSQKRYASELLHQLVSVSSKIGAGIVGLGGRVAKGTANFLRRLGRPFIDARSSLKRKIKERKRIESVLRICIVVTSFGVAAAISSILGPIPFLEEMGIESDTPGVRTGVERGLTFLIING
jgi:hypothetical protein